MSQRVDQAVQIYEQIDKLQGEMTNRQMTMLGLIGEFTDEEQAEFEARTGIDKIDEATNEP